MANIYIIKNFNLKYLVCINECKFMSLKYEAVNLDFTLQIKAIFVDAQFC